VDDATRAAVRARLSIYPRTPREIAWKLRLQPAPRRRASARYIIRDRSAADLEIVSEPEASLAPTMSMQPDDAAKLIALFLETDGRHRAQFLHGLATTPLKPSTPVDPKRAARAVANLEKAAMAGDSAGFIDEIADALILTGRVAGQIVNEPGGEALACALKALGMPAEVFQRVLLFLNPNLGVR